MVVVFGMRHFQDGPDHSGRRLSRLGRASALVMAGWVLAFPGRASASSLPEPIDVTGDRSGMAPATATFTAPAHILPTSFTLPIPAISRLEAGRTLIQSSDFTLSSMDKHREPGEFTALGFSGRLMARMQREALRYRRQNMSDVTAVPDRVFEDLDSEALKRRSHEASRIVTRSVRRALDVEIERLARTSLGLGRTIDLLGSLSSRGTRSRPPASPGSAQAGMSPSVPGAADGGWRGGIGMRLDAHPALLMRAEASRLSGRLEIPVRNEPIRLSLDCPLGSRGRAVLSSGMPRDGQGWATVMLNFSF
jgi:hypothetical protein